MHYSNPIAKYRLVLVTLLALMAWNCENVSPLPPYNNPADQNANQARLWDYRNPVSSLNAFYKGSLYNGAFYSFTDQFNGGLSVISPTASNLTASQFSNYIAQNSGSFVIQGNLSSSYDGPYVGIGFMLVNPQRSIQSTHLSLSLKDTLCLAFTIPQAPNASRIQISDGSSGFSMPLMPASGCQVFEQPFYMFSYNWGTRMTIEEFFPNVSTVDFTFNGIPLDTPFAMVLHSIGFGQNSCSCP